MVRPGKGLYVCIYIHILSSVSQSVVRRPAALTAPKSMLEMQILRPHPAGLNKNLWGWGLRICMLTSSPGSLRLIKV